MIQRVPTLFSCSIDTNFEPKLDWLQERLHLDDVALSKMIQLLPTLFSCSIDTNLEPKLDWLQQRLDLDDEAARKMVTQFPPLFGYNVDSNLEPTLNFYIDAQGSKEGALALVVQTPSLFSSSLEKRLKPRLECARDAGIMIDAGCLQRIAQQTNDRWHASLLFQARKVDRMDIKIRSTRLNTLDAMQ